MLNASKFVPRSFDATLALLCRSRGDEFVTKQQGVNAAYLSQYCKVSEATVSAWINGERQPGFEQLQALCRAFTVKPAQMLGKLPIADIDLVAASTAAKSNTAANKHAINGSNTVTSIGGLSPEECELLAAFRNADNAARTLLLGVARLASGDKLT